MLPDIVEEVESGEDFSSSVIESFKKGTIKGLEVDNTLESFGFSSNPFDITNLISHPNLIIEKTKETIKNLAERIGACHKAEGHLLIVGPEGTGRTSILRLLSATFNKGLDKNFSSYVYAPKTWHGFSSEENSEGERIDNFQKWMSEINFSNTKVVLVDDADSFVSSARQYADAIRFEHLEVPTMIYCITPTTYSSISKNNLLRDFFADIFWIARLDNKDVREIISRSIDRFKSDSNPFDEVALDKIVEYSFGLPGLAVHMALLILRNAYQVSAKRIDNSIVDSIVSNEGYDVAHKIMHREIKLDGTKYKIAIEILSQLYLRDAGAERTIIISKFSDLATSTLSYHLKDLINDSIITQQRTGYKVYYFISKPVRSVLQLMIQSPSIIGGNNN